MSTVEEDPQPKPNNTLEFLRREQLHYSADAAVARATLTGTTLITIMSPEGGVVARHMKAVRKSDRSITSVPTEMTRARRPYDWKKDRPAEKGTTLETFEAAVKEHSLLHYAITASGEVFGSRVTDVVGRHAIMHVGFDSFYQIDERALRQWHNVYLLTTGAAYAASMGLDKLTPDDADRADQIEYGLGSIEFARDNIDNDLHKFMLVQNTDKSVADTVAAISRLAQHNGRESINKNHIEDTLSEMEVVLEEAKKRISVQ